MPTVLCDSGPLIALAKVNRLRLLLDLWGNVHVTEEVYKEAVALGHELGAPDALTIRLFWQKHKLPVIAVSENVLIAYQPAITLDPGERSTFAHALTLGDVLVLVDDEDARTEASPWPPCTRHNRSTGRGSPPRAAYNARNRASFQRDFRAS